MNDHARALQGSDGGPVSAAHSPPDPLPALDELNALFGEHGVRLVLSPIEYAFIQGQIGREDFVTTAESEYLEQFGDYAGTALGLRAEHIKRISAYLRTLIEHAPPSGSAADRARSVQQ